MENINDLMERLAPPGGYNADLRNLENPRIPLTAKNISTYLGAGEQSDAGISVTPQNAVSLTAVWAAVNLLAGTIGQLPVGVYQKTDDGREPVGKHPITRLLGLQPNEDMTGQVFREAVMYNLLMYGVGYALIDRNGSAQPRQLIPLMSQHTRRERVNGITRIITMGANGKTVTFRPMDVLIIPGLTTDGLSVISPISAGKQSIGASLAAQRSAGSFFGKGARPGGVLEHPGSLSPEAAGRLRDSWERLHEGSKNDHRTAILEEGMKFHATATEPEKAQLLESRKFAVSEVSRVFGVPPHLIMDLERATFSNIEHQDIGFIKYSVNRWVVRWEQECAIKLLSESEKQRDYYIKLNVNGFMRGDSKARAEYLTRMVGGGIMKINEARALEEFNAVDGGNELLVPANNMAPLSSVGNEQPGPPSDETNSVRNAWLSDTTRRLVGEESRLVISAVRRHLVKPSKPDMEGFKAWVEQYYDKFRSKMASEYSGPVGEVADALAERHVVSSIGQIMAIVGEVPIDDLADALVERADEWKATRWQLPNAEDN